MFLGVCDLIANLPIQAFGDDESFKMGTLLRH
jgi:hypothetical protein